MIPTWPNSLPSCPLADGYRETPSNTVLRSSMDAGPQKTRRRFTAGVTPMPVTYTLTVRQVKIFEDFFEHSTRGGALPFMIPHPRRKVLVTVLFTGDEMYELAPLGGGATYWRLTMNLQIQP